MPEAELYRNLLSATYRTFLSRAVPEAMTEVRFYQKSRAWLVAEERWEDLEAAHEYFRRVGQLLRRRSTRACGGRGR